MAAGEYERMAQVEDDHWWYRTLRQLVIDVFTDHRLSPRTRVLDAGCGTGGGLVEWARVVAPIGIDISPEALARCVRRSLVPLARGSVETLPIRSASVDAVVTLDVLCLRGVDPTRALAEIHRVIRPGGLVIMNLPAFDELRGQHDTAVRIGRRHRKGDVVRILRTSGFVRIKVRYWNGLLFPVAWLVRRIRRGQPDRTASSDLARLPGVLNSLLATLLRVETRVFSEGPPFGSSVFAVAERALVEERVR